MDELDVKITLEQYSKKVFRAKNTKELREIVANLKKDLDLRKIFFEGHCGLCKWCIMEMENAYDIPFRQMKCQKHDKIVKNSLVCCDFELKNGNQINI